MNRIGRRLVSLALALVMALTLFPMPEAQAQAASVEEGGNPVYSITVNQTGAGTVQVCERVDNTTNAVTEAAENTRILMLLTPDEGYAYLEPTAARADGATIYLYEASSSGIFDGADYYYFYMPAQNVTVTVNFGKTYPLTLDVTGGNTNGSSIGTVSYYPRDTIEGSEINVNVTTGNYYSGVFYELKSLAVKDEDGIEIGTTVESSSDSSTQYRFTMPSKAVTVSAKLAPKILVDQYTNGTVTPDRESANAGETVTLTPKADAGYRLYSLTAVGIEDYYSKIGKEIAAQATRSGQYTFVMPDKPVQVKAVFRKLYSVTAEPGEHGTVTTDDTAYMSGETVTIIPNPDEGYQLKNVTAYSETAPEETAGSDILYFATGFPEKQFNFSGENPDLHTGYGK